MKARLKHSWKEMIEKGIMSKQDWPKTDKGTYKKDNGQLPLHISPPNFLADPNHRKKVVGKLLYAMAIAPKKVSNIDKPLAQRLKDYWVHI